MSRDMPDVVYYFPVESEAYRFWDAVGAAVAVDAVQSLAGACDPYICPCACHEPEEWIARYWDATPG